MFERKIKSTIILNYTGTLPIFLECKVYVYLVCRIEIVFHVYNEQTLDLHNWLVFSLFLLLIVLVRLVLHHRFDHYLY